MTHPPSVEAQADVQDVPAEVPAHVEAPVDDVDPAHVEAPFEDVDRLFDGVLPADDAYVAHLSEMYGHHDSLTPKQLPPGPLWNFQRVAAGVLLFLASGLFLVVVFSSPVFYAQVVAFVACVATSLLSWRLISREARLRREAIREREEFE